MPIAYQSLKLDWLIESNAATIITPGAKTTDWHPVPLPEEVGKGGAFGLQLELGMSLFRVEYQFKAPRTHQLLPLADIELMFPEPAFMVESMARGNAVQYSKYPSGEFLNQVGVDLFRLTDRLDFRRVLDTSADIQGTGLMVGQTTLAELLGREEAQLLYERLDIARQPQATARKIPIDISGHLHKAMSSNWSPQPGRLYAQARVLDYFDGLIVFMAGQHAQSNAKPAQNVRTRSHDLYDYLTQLDGKVPTLLELARQFSSPAKRLNADFKATFGTSIYNFIIHERLERARLAIVQSDVPLKQLADRLGYAHFNHFGAAFKKKFGYSPGSLRVRK